MPGVRDAGSPNEQALLYVHKPLTQLTNRINWVVGPPISDAKNPPLSANHNGGSPPSLGRTQDAGSSLRPTRSAVPRLAKTDDVRPNTTRLPKPAFATTTTELSHDLRTPGDILFVRSRLFYSKPSYNSRGQIFFGLRHIRRSSRLMHVVEHYRPSRACLLAQTMMLPLRSVPSAC